MKKVTIKELEEMIVGEIHKIEGCEGVTSIQIYRQPGEPNWRLGQFVGRNEWNDMALVEQAAKKIAERLQLEYELIPDAV